jgi:hypothetical protein
MTPCSLARRARLRCRVWKLADRVLRTGSADSAQQGRPPGGGKLAAYLAISLEWVDTEPDITMPELV